MNSFTAQQLHDLKILARFVQLYCRSRHRDRASVTAELPAELLRGRPELRLCPDCKQLLEYGVTRRALCPLEPKPSCKNCHIHCYSPEYRRKIKEIMAFSGKRMLLRGRLDYLWHYFLH